MKSRTQDADHQERSSGPSPGATSGQPSAEAQPASRWRAALPWPVLAAAVAAAGIAAAVAGLVFPLLSINNDEAVYLLQADALAHRSLFPRAPEPLSAFRPWFMVARDGHYLSKYTPFYPALLALSKVLTGGTTAALMLVAAAIPVVTYLLAREVTAERRTAVVAALLVAGSPLVVVHTGLHLSYLPTLVLLEVFAWMLLRGVRTRAGGWLAGAGLALSAAATTRPYDAVLFGLPMLAWALLRRPCRERARDVAWIVAGGLLPVALLVAYNVRAMGGPLRLPFSVIEPLDKLGFGVRKMFPTDGRHHFGPWQGVKGVASHMRELGAWSAGGVVTMALAVMGFARRRSEKPLVALAGAWVTFPLGYLFFWGPWNASLLWTGTRYFGPFYFIPLLPSLGILAASALVDLRTTRRLTAAVLAGAIALSSLATTAVALRAHTRFSADEQRLAALLDAPGGRQLVFVGLYPAFLMHPSAVLSNDWQASGQRVFALRNSATDLQVAERLSGRTLLQLGYKSRRRPDPTSRTAANLRRLDLVDATTLPLSLHVRLPSPERRLLLTVSAAGRTTTFDLGHQDSADIHLPPLHVSGDGDVSVSGIQAAGIRYEKTKPQTIHFHLFGTRGKTIRSLASQEITAAIGGGRVQALVPGASLGHFGTMKPPRLDISSV